MSTDSRLDRFIDALPLKEERRTGWQLRGVEQPESVADHSWGTAYLCLLFADEAGVDADSACRMAVVHDLAEARTGDVATRVARMDDPAVKEEKRVREAAAMDRLLDGVDQEKIRASWEEYEASVSETARFVRDMNMIDLCAQAFCYERDRRYDEHASREHFRGWERMAEFFATTEPRLSTSVGRRLFSELRARYDSLPE